VRMPSEVLLERLSWPEVRDALDEGVTTAIIPSGSTEQHGTHLPLCVDTRHATAIAVAVAQRLGNCLVTPTVAVGCSPHHMAFPGTLSLAAATFGQIHADYCQSLAQHGFEAICCFSTHGGNFEPLREAVPRLEAIAGPRCRVVAFTDMDAFLGVWQAAVEAQAEAPLRIGGHADIAESSVMLALEPELVHEELAKPGFTGEMTGARREEMMAKGVIALSVTGVLGNPLGMNRDLGIKCLERMVDFLADYFSKRLLEEHGEQHANTS
jgi:creatinine amidohydrolase